MAIRYDMIAVDEVLFVLEQSFTVHNQGEYKVVSPPEQRTERQRAGTLEVLGEIQILVRTILQMFSFDELKLLAVKTGRSQQFHPFQVFTQAGVQVLQHAAHLLHDLRLRAEEFRIRDEIEFLFCKNPV